MPIDAAAQMAEPTPTDDELENFDDSQLDKQGGDAPVEDKAAEPSNDDQTAEPAAEPEKKDPLMESTHKDEPPPKKVSGMIPRGRYNYAAQKRREAEAEAEALRTRVAELEAAKLEEANAEADAAESTLEMERQIDALDAKIDDARKDGDTTLARQLRAEQRKLERELVRSEVTPEPAETIDPNAVSEAAVEQIRLEGLIPRLEQEYPMLQEGSDTFDAELSEEVMDAFDLFSARLPRDQALYRATVYVTSAHGITPAGQQPAARTTDKARNLKAAAAQPPELDGSGVDSDKGGAQRKLDVMHMTQDEFERLGDAELDRLLA